MIEKKKYLKITLIMLFLELLLEELTGSKDGLNFCPTLAFLVGLVFISKLKGKNEELMKKINSRAKFR